MYSIVIIRRNMFVYEFFLKFCSLFSNFFLDIGAEMPFVVEYALGVGGFKHTGNKIW